MSRRWLIAIAIAGTTLTTTSLTAAELPKSDDDESFDVEPPILIPNRDRDQSPTATGPAANPVSDPERLQRDLDRAIRNASGAERLFKMGVLAKAEVEQRMLRVVRLQSDLAAARLAAIQEEAQAQTARAAAGEISAEERAQAERKLAEAVQAADAAAAKREKAELEAAETNLRRQQKLTEFGIGRKSELVRAQEKLAELKAAKN